MSLWYLATPYSKYPFGTQQAFEDAAKQSALLVKHGIPVFCPITHSHPMVPYIPMCQDNHETWLSLDRAFMDVADGLIVCQLPDWENSYGVKYEINYMRHYHKPIIWMTPDLVPIVLLDPSTQTYRKPTNFDLARQYVPVNYTRL